MKKQYLIPLVLILVLGTYLLLKKDDQRNYDLPTPPAIEQSEIDRITIQGPLGHLELKREKSTWLLTDDQKEFEADTRAVDKMLDTLTHLRITALASEKQDRQRYQLADDQALEVTAFETDNEKLRLRIGKPSPTGNHTFVMLGSDTKIYHAAKNFRSDFQGSLDDFRNKQVLNFQRGGLKKFLVHAWGETKAFTAVAPDKKTDQKDSVLAFKAADDSKADAKVITDLISTLSDLTCDEFPRGLTRAELEKSDPICKITLENGETMVLNLFGEKGLATSSMVPFPFKLQSYTAKDIQSYVEKLTGTEQAKETDKKE